MLSLLSCQLHLATWQTWQGGKHKINMKIPKNKAMTRTQLASYYGVCLATFNKMLVKVSDFTFDKSSRILTPREIDTIIEHLGNPDPPD